MLEKPTVNKLGENENKIDTAFSQLVNVKTLMDNIANVAATNFGLGNTLNIIGAIDLKTMEVAKSFGVGSERAEDITKALVSARDGVFALGGDWNDLVKTQTDTAKALGRNITLGVEGQKELYAAYKVTGQAVETIVTNLKNVGISAYDAGDAMFKVVKAANDTGVSAQKVSEMVMTNISQMNQFNFKDGVEGLARMAAQATSMRIDMKDVMTTATKAFDPQGAITMAAELQKLGVTQSELLDPLSLMNMAENDPEELQNQISQMSKQFVQLNKDGQFEILPGAKRQMMAIEKSLGMGTGSLAKMALASAETEEKMKRIQFPDFMTEEQKKTLANLTEMKEGKMMIEVEGEMKTIEDALKDVQEKGQAGLEKLLKKPEKKSIEEIAEDQLSYSQKIAANTSILSEMLPAALATSPEMQKVFKSMVAGTKKVREKVTGGGGTTELAKTVMTAIANIKKEGQQIDITQFTNAITEPFKKLFPEEYTTKINALLSEVQGKTEDIEIYKTVAEYFNKITDVKDAIISPKLGTFKTLPEDEIFVGTGLSEMFNKMSEMKTEIPQISESFIPNLPNLQTQETKVTSEVKETTKEIKIDLNINVTAPPQIDTNEITKVLKDQLVIQQIIQKIEQVSTNNNLTKSPK